MAENIGAFSVVLELFFRPVLLRREDSRASTATCAKRFGAPKTGFIISPITNLSFCPLSNFASSTARDMPGTVIVVDLVWFAVMLRDALSFDKSSLNFIIFSSSLATATSSLVKSSRESACMSACVVLRADCSIVAMSSISSLSFLLVTPWFFSPFMPHLPLREHSFLASAMIASMLFLASAFDLVKTLLTVDASPNKRPSSMREASASRRCFGGMFSKNFLSSHKLSNFDGLFEIVIPRPSGYRVVSNSHSKGLAPFAKQSLTSFKPPNSGLGHLAEAVTAHTKGAVRASIDLA